MIEIEIIIEIITAEETVRAAMTMIVLETGTTTTKSGGINLLRNTDECHNKGTQFRYIMRIRCIAANIIAATTLLMRTRNWAVTMGVLNVKAKTIIGWIGLHTEL